VFRSSVSSNIAFLHSNPPRLENQPAVLRERLGPTGLERTPVAVVICTQVSSPSPPLSATNPFYTDLFPLIQLLLGFHRIRAPISSPTAMICTVVMPL
jgi:hypothetical protein